MSTCTESCLHKFTYDVTDISLLVRGYMLVVLMSPKHLNNMRAARVSDVNNMKQSFEEPRKGYNGEAMQ
jgi:hypothetical protein